MKYIYIIGLLCIFFVQNNACKRFVTIPAPVDKLVTKSVFNNDAAATSALTVIYSQMVGNTESFNISQSTGLLGDELISYAKSGNNYLFYTNSMLSSQTTGPWNTAYSYIYQVNAIIEGLTTTAGVSLAVKNQLIGESEFIRSFWFFNLVNLYGDIPMPLTTDYSKNSVISRTPTLKVYEQIVADLKDAKQRLSASFVDNTDTAITTERVRPTKWAASALLARVYLYLEDYESAKSESSIVIGNGSLFQLCDSLNSVFLMNSSEAIWQLAIPLPATINTYDGRQYILTARPNSISLSPQIVNAFDSNDRRKKSWVGVLSTGGSTFYYPYKYKVLASPNISEYVMVFRLAEQYLIRAEAEAELNQIGIAVADLNIIRARAGLDSVSPSVSQDDLLRIILHERQVELFTEWGHRWFDLIRTRAIDSVMSGPNGVCANKGGVWRSNSGQTIFPIPLNEILKDHNLTQNSGY